MAAGGSFKQQCPSCEAMVLIKDRKLIGTKIDCTSCKYRFVVKPPVGAEAEEEPKEAAKPTAKAGPAKKPAAKAGAAPVKKKVGPRKPLEAEDDDEPAPEQPKEGRNTTMIAGIGLAVFCVLLLGVGGYYLLSDSNDSPTIKTTGTKRSTAKVDQGPPPVVVVKDTGEVPTNLLPNDTQVVLNVLIDGAVEEAAFHTPGAFSAAQLERKLGLKAKEVEGLLVGLSLDARRRWTFAILRIHTGKAIDEGALKNALNLQPGGNIKGKEYFLTPPSPWLSNLERMALQSLPFPTELPAEPEARALGLHIVNPTVLIVADQAPLKEFLEAGGGEQKYLTPKAAAGSGKKGEEDRDRYLSIDPALKQALDRVEGKLYKDRLLSLAWDMNAFKPDPMKDALKKLAGNPLVTASGLPLDPMAERLGEIKAGAFGVKMVAKSCVVSLALETKDKGSADFWQDTLASFGRKVNELPGLASLPIRLEISGRTVGPKDENVPKVTLSSQTQGSAWVANAEMSRDDYGRNVNPFLQPRMVLLRTASDMAEGPSRIFNLAAATKTMSETDLKDPAGTAYKGFPIGTWPRKLPGDRFNRPYPPYERVGWMPLLLPYLGYESTFRQIHMDDPWRVPGQNAKMGEIPVPAFLDSRYPRDSWWATVRDPAGREMRFGATHFVGVAGVGMDAADHPLTDPRAGVFGYDRFTRFDDIKDGRAETILMLQVPPSPARPWIAGGGATIMGVPDKGSVKPFVLPDIKHDGKKGTYAIMADGSVRFIAETIPDDVFKAMRTINGSEKVDLTKETVQHELKAKPEK